MSRRCWIACVLLVVAACMGSTTPGGCANPDLGDVTALVTNGMATTITADHDPANAGDMVIFTAHVSGFVTITGYTWTVDGVEKASSSSRETSNTVAIKMDTSGRHLVEVKVSAYDDEDVLLKARQDQAALYIQVLSSGGSTGSKPDVSLAADRYAATTGESVTVTATASGGTPPYTYFWFMDGGTGWGAGQRTYTQTMNTAGTRSVYCVVQDAAGTNSDEYSVDITVSEATSNGGTDDTFQLTSSATSIELWGKVTFTVLLADGGIPPRDYTYRWFVDGQDLGTQAYTVSPLFTLQSQAGRSHTILVHVLDFTNLELVQELQTTLYIEAED